MHRNHYGTTLMRFSFVILFSLGAAVIPATARAQVPTSTDARKLLDTRPELVEQLRTKLLASGMTADQVHAKLKSFGYPETLLDRYMPGVAADASPPQPVDSVLKAVNALGLGDLSGPASAPAAMKLGDILPQSRRDTVPVQPPRLVDTTTIAPKNQPLRIFGMEVFQHATTQFDASDVGVADVNYQVGPRDQLVVILTGDVEAAYTLDVTREGFVVIPRVGEVYVANLTLAQISDLLYSRFQRVYATIGRRPDSRIRFSVSMARVRSNQVFVLGDVNAPASYQVSGLGTVMTALYAAGGPSRSGSMRNIEVHRGPAIVGREDLYDYLLRGISSRDIRLESGDVVFVPYRGKRVALTGAVGRQAIYEMRDDETLADLLRFGGGFDAAAAHDRVQVSRILPAGQRSAAGRERVVIDVPLANGGATDMPSFILADNDSVFVFSISDRVRNRIAVTGSVWSPGPQGLTPGLRLSAALRAAGGVKPDAYLGDLLVSRRLPDETRIQLHSSLLDRNGRVSNDLVLQEDDEVQVFSASDFRNVRKVSIAGPVKAPGEFEFHEGITLRDAILLAGNFPDTSDVYRDALITRLNGDLTHTLIRQQVRDPDGGLNTFPLVAGDSITVYSLSQFRTPRTVGIAGMVRKPGVFAYRDGMTLRDLVQLAGGLADGALLSRAELARRIPNGDGSVLADTLSVPLDSTFLFNFDAADRASARPGVGVPVATAPDIALQPLDNVLILRVPNFELPKTVVLTGEFKYPGTYTLQRKDERLSDLVRRAGGFTAQAYPGGARFIRKDDQAGRIDVDLERALHDDRSIDDFAMVDGDSLFIPRFIPTVKIGGAVNSPASVAYREGKDLRYYVNAAGGATQDGDEEKSYVLQPNGKIESYRGHRFRVDEIPVPKAGAIITVPIKEKKPDVDIAGITASIAQTIAGLITLIVIIRR